MPRVLFSTLALLLATSAVRAQEAFDLLKYIPPQANTVAVINTANILASPRAVKEGWSKLESTEYLAGAVPLSPHATLMVLAKQIDEEDPSRGGTIALIPITKGAVLPDLAKRIGGQETSIGGEDCVLSPTGIYYFKFSDKLLGSVRTDNKQDIVRWLQFVKNAKESQLQKILNAAVAQSPKHHITLAIDTVELYEAQQVDIAVAMAKSIQENEAQSKLIAKFLKGLQGVIFTANIGNTGIEARIRFDSKAYDFKIDPELFKSFIIETMSRNGAMLQDMQTAKVTKGDTSVTLTFMISDKELGRVMSLVVPPGAIPTNHQDIAVASGKANAQSTLKYFNAVNTILDNLKAQNKKAQDYQKTALWHETAANKIEALSTIGVDKKVIEYGYGTASKLYTIAQSLKGVPAKVEDLQGEVYAMGYMPRRGLFGAGGGRLNPFAYGNSQIQSNAGEIYNKQAKVIKEDEKNRVKIWDMIDSKRSETRGLIASEYKVVPPEPKE